MTTNINTILFGIYIAMFIAGLIGYIYILLKIRDKRGIKTVDLLFEGDTALKESKDISLNKFIPLASSRFSLFSGEFNSDFYDEKVLKEFTRVIEERGVEMRGIYGPAFDIDCVGLLKMALEGKMKLYRINKRRDDIPHFRVIDGRHVCMDIKPHPVFKGHVGGFWFNNITLGRKKEKDFEKILKDAEYMSPGKILEMVENATEVEEEGILDKPCFIKHDKEKDKGYRPATDGEIKHLREQLETYIKEAHI